MLKPMHATCTKCPADAPLLREVPPITSLDAQGYPYVGYPTGLFRCPQGHEFRRELDLAHPTRREAPFVDVHSPSAG